MPDTGCFILVLLTHLQERLLTTLQRCKAAKYTLHCFQSKISLVWKRGASRANITQGAALKRNGMSLSKAKKLLPRTCYPLRLASLPQP